MFEKEAEEYDKKVFIKDFEYHYDIQKTFQDTSEFGYNKANEWHYVKDGDLPKENQLVLLYRENPNGANIALTYWFQAYVKDKVIAWKEIVLPELKESK